MLFVLSHFLRSVRWKIMISTLKPDVKVLNTFGAMMIGYGVNCVVPRLGEVYRGLFLGKWEGVSRSSMLGTIILERIIDVIMLLVAVIVSVFVYNGDLFNDVAWLKSTIYISTGAAVVFVAFAILFFLWKTEVSEHFIKNILSFSPKLADKVSYVFHTLMDGVAGLRGTKNWLFTCLLSLVVIIVYALTTYVGLYMFNLYTSQEITFAMAWVISALGSFGVIIPTPGGTGSYHAISIFLLVELYSFNSESAAAYAILTHFISYVVFISCSMFFIFYINQKRRNRGEKSENFFSVFKLERE